MSDIQEESIKKMVDEAIAGKIKEYRKIVIAFLSGVGILFIFLIVNGLVSQEALIVKLHDAVFGVDVEKDIQEYLLQEVAVSYNNQFWLGTDGNTSSSNQIFFYATERQDVNAIVSLQHIGSGEMHEVFVKLDGLPASIYEGSDDINFQLFPLGSRLEEARAQFFPTANKNVHFLVFGIKSRDIVTDDKILVQVLINVNGGGGIR
jgi:hypothetical protein